MTTWGTITDFKYLLPRLFELQAQKPFIDTEILFGKLQYAYWNQWSMQEQEAIRLFFVSYWHSVLQEELEEPITASEEVLGNRFSLIIPLLAPATRTLPHQEAVQHVRNQQLGWTSISDSLMRDRAS
jgi:hypothetical protein